MLAQTCFVLVSLFYYDLILTLNQTHGYNFPLNMFTSRMPSYSSICIAYIWSVLIQYLSQFIQSKDAKMASRRNVDPDFKEKNPKAKGRPTRNGKNPKGDEKLTGKDDEKSLKAPLGSCKYSKRIVHENCVKMTIFSQNNVETG